jgi:hypothetical protein
VEKMKYNAATSGDKKAGWDVDDKTPSREALRLRAQAVAADQKGDSMLDRLLSGEKLWYTAAPGGVQEKMMRKVREQIRIEHDWMCEHEPQDQFHTCVLLGALNLIDGLLDRRKKVKHGLV